MVGRAGYPRSLHCSVSSHFTSISLRKGGNLTIQQTLRTVAVAISVSFALFTNVQAGNNEVECPSDIHGNECEYYKDGYRAGREDGSASMSMAYERHAESYDGRFESYFAQGYEAGWAKNR